METVELKVEGMDCEGCVKSVTRMLSGVPGVQKVDVSLAQASARVTYDPARTGRKISIRYLSGKKWANATTL